jgi:TolA-binding protein
MGIFCCLSNPYHAPASVHDADVYQINELQRQLSLLKIQLASREQQITQLTEKVSDLQEEHEQLLQIQQEALAKPATPGKEANTGTGAPVMTVAVMAQPATKVSR